MIFLDRTKAKKPAILEETYLSGDWKGKTERQRAIDFFILNGTIKGFKFERYNDRTVKDALAALSGHKCAYCESDIGATQPVEVEHYRPKSIVIIKKSTGEFEQRYGYYWLASDWKNLLPSCIDCNRQRYHQSEEEGLILSGKKNLFPISDESKRAMKPGDEEDEDGYRLLLDPCRDTPENYLEFGDDGVVRAKSQPDQNDTLKGKTTIEVYGLWRPGLVKMRKGTCIKIKDCINSVKRDYKQLKYILTLLEEDPENSTYKEMKDIAEEGLAQHLSELYQYQKAEKEYAGMARQIIKEHFPNLMR